MNTELSIIIRHLICVWEQLHRRMAAIEKGDENISRIRALFDRRRAIKNLQQVTDCGATEYSNDQVAPLLVLNNRAATAIATHLAFSRKKWQPAGCLARKGRSVDSSCDSHRHRLCRAGCASAERAGVRMAMSAGRTGPKNRQLRRGTMVAETTVKASLVVNDCRCAHARTG